MTKVAVITRTKERPVFLSRAIASVANQSFRDFVHVIVNDGGKKADIEAVLEKFDTDTRSKIKVFHREHSSGAPDTIFNESIDRVDSDYFAIHDDDDTWHKDFLKHTVGYLNDSAHLAAVVVATDRIDEQIKNDGSIQMMKTSPWMADVKVINLYRQCIDNQFTPISTLFRRSAYIAVGKFDSNLPVVGDWEFGIRLLLKYDADFLNPGYPLAFYHHRRFQAGSMASSSFGEGTEKHRYYTNMIMNKYLRDELAQGRVGVGYIMSKLKYDQGNLSTIAQRIMPSFIVDRLKKRVRN